MSLETLPKPDSNPPADKKGDEKAESKPPVEAPPSPDDTKKQFWSDAAAHLERQIAALRDELGGGKSPAWPVYIALAIALLALLSVFGLGAFIFRAIKEDE